MLISFYMQISWCKQQTARKQAAKQ